MVDIVDKIIDFKNEQKGKGRPHMLASRPSDLSHVANVSKRKISDYLNLKILSPKLILRRLPIALAQVKAGNTSENLLNEIREIIHSLYRAKEITEKVYNNVKKSIKL